MVRKALLTLCILALPVLAWAQGGSSSSGFPRGCATGQTATYSSVTGLWSCATPVSLNGNTITTGTGTLTLGSATLNAGAGGTLGSNAFSSVSFLPLAGGTLVGNLIFTDNTYDIGASGATRPRTGYFGTSVVTPAITVGSLTGLLRADAGVVSVDASAIEVLRGTSASIGGGLLTIGVCTSGTASVTGATTAMVATASPVTYPGDGTYWLAYVSAADTVTVKVCAVGSITPSATTYRVAVAK